MARIICNKYYVISMTINMCHKCLKSKGKDKDKGNGKDKDKGKGKDKGKYKDKGKGKDKSHQRPFIKNYSIKIN